MATRKDPYRYWGHNLRAPKKSKFPTERKVTNNLGGYDIPTTIEDIKAWLDQELGSLTDGTMEVYGEDYYGSATAVVNISGWEPISAEVAQELVGQYEAEVAAHAERARIQDEKQLELLRQRRPDLFEGEQ